MSDATGGRALPSVPAIRILGTGAVSPAGWGCEALGEALCSGKEIASRPLPRPGWQENLLVRQVPPPASRPEFLKNPRLRRASAITQYAVAAALEAIGPHADACGDASLPLGVILCTMSGCVQYSRRFYSETLQDPATASPLVFPETVFNAPASHLASLLGSAVVDYTLVGDTSTYFQGLAMAAHWLGLGKVGACLVVGAEEMDWPTADAFRLFSRDMTLSAGAGALFLQAGQPTSKDAILECVPTPRGYLDARSRCLAMARVKEELPRPGKDDLLCDGRQDIDRMDRPETLAWKSWTGARISPKRILGEGLTSAAAWQCIVAVSALRDGPTRRAIATNAGCNQQAGGVSFLRPTNR